MRVQCTGTAEKFYIAVQSNFGSQYQEAPATATITDNTTTASKTVIISRLTRFRIPGNG